MVIEFLVNKMEKKHNNLWLSIWNLPKSTGVHSHFCLITIKNNHKFVDYLGISHHALQFH